MAVEVLRLLKQNPLSAIGRLSNGIFLKSKVCARNQLICTKWMLFEASQPGVWKYFCTSSLEQRVRWLAFLQAVFPQRAVMWSWCMLQVIGEDWKDGEKRPLARCFCSKALKTTADVYGEGFGKGHSPAPNALCCINRGLEKDFTDIACSLCDAEGELEGTIMELWLATCNSSLLKICTTKSFEISTSLFI